MRISLLLAVLITSCGTEKGDPGATGAKGSNAVTQKMSQSVTANTICATLNGYSYKKTSANSKKVKLYTGTSCGGSTLTTLDSKGNDVYSTSTGVIILEGDSSATLTITQYIF